MGKFNVRYMYEVNGSLYWMPGKHLRALGFVNEPLGKDLPSAVARAEELNRRADAERYAPAAKIATMGTIDWLISQYKEDLAYTSKSNKTREGYDTHLASISKWCGDHRIESVSRRAVKAWHRAIYNKYPAKADAAVRVLKLLFNFYIEDNPGFPNPAARIKLVHQHEDTMIWTEEQLLAFTDKARELGYPSIEMAAWIAVNTLQREGDVLTVRWSDRKPEGIYFQQSKTKRRLVIPESGQLRGKLDGAKRKGVNMVIFEGRRQPYKARHFKAKVKEVREAAGLPDGLKFMGLRHTGIVMMARGGATATQISHVSVHSIESVQKILDKHYIPRDGEIAQSGIAKLDDYREQKAKKS